MKKLLILVSVLTLQGCLYQNISYTSIIAAKSACAEYKGVHTISEHFDGHTEVRCNESKYIDLDDYVRTKGEESLLNGETYE